MNRANGKIVRKWRKSAFSVVCIAFSLLFVELGVYHKEAMKIGNKYFSDTCPWPMTENFQCLTLRQKSDYEFRASLDRKRNRQ